MMGAWTHIPPPLNRIEMHLPSAKPLWSLADKPHYPLLEGQLRQSAKDLDDIVDEGVSMIYD